MPNRRRSSTPAACLPSEFFHPLPRFFRITPGAEAVSLQASVHGPSAPPYARSFLRPPSTSHHHVVSSQYHLAVGQTHGQDGVRTHTLCRLSHHRDRKRRKVRNQLKAEVNTANQFKASVGGTQQSSTSPTQRQARISFTSARTCPVPSRGFCSSAYHRREPPRKAASGKDEADGRGCSCRGRCPPWG